MVNADYANVSVLYREPKLLKDIADLRVCGADGVSVLYREPKLLKAHEQQLGCTLHQVVSVLYREPKLLKVAPAAALLLAELGFQCSTVSRNC